MESGDDAIHRVEVGSKRMKTDTPRTGAQHREERGVLKDPGEGRNRWRSQAQQPDTMSLAPTPPAGVTGEGDYRVVVPGAAQAGRSEQSRAAEAKEQELREAARKQVAEMQAKAQMHDPGLDSLRLMPAGVHPLPSST